MFETYNYFPSIKTTDAELKGYANLNASVKKGVLPIFEITRSRTSKLDRIGRVQKRIDQIKDVSKGNPFILDLTSHEELMNAEIEMLFDNANGYEAWRQFLANFTTPVIPMIHYVSDDPEDDTIMQVKELEQRHKYLAYRFNPLEANMVGVISLIADSMEDSSNLTLILDVVDIVAKPAADKAFTAMHSVIENIANEVDVTKFITMSSSFPKSVLDRVNDDHHGSFSIREVAITQALQEIFSSEIVKHGDYASIHPVRYQTPGGNWVPRIDVPLDKEYIYYRYRRDEGGYEKAANQVVADNNYRKIKQVNTWGDEEIGAAALGIPNGISPSHWIAVRLNLHITRQYFRTL